MTDHARVPAQGSSGEQHRLTFRAYVEDRWLPGHVMEATTRQTYTYQIYRHLMPSFGPVPIIEIDRAAVREWIAHLAGIGVRPASILPLKMLLSAVFSTALDDGIVQIHPCKGIKVPHVPTKARRIVTPEEFDRIYRCIDDPQLQLLVETDVESGLRWGELTELRVADLDWSSRILTVSRTVVCLTRRFHPTGGRFLVKDYPKDKQSRRLKLSEHITGKLKTHIEALRLGPDDLIFAIRDTGEPNLRPRRPDPFALGLSEPGVNGRRHWHGTTTCYQFGCRCQHCKDAYADYRAERRSRGLDNPHPARKLDTDGHIPDGWFRNQVWLPALDEADLGFHVRPHDLRHTHASWLLAGGADLQVVKDRLGHADIATTAHYLHTLPTADETALAALGKIRRSTHWPPVR